MSALVARGWRRAAIVGGGNAQQFLPIGLRGSSNPCRAARHLSTASFMPKKPLDGIDKFLLGSICLMGATVAKEYYDFSQEQRALATKHEPRAHEEAPRDVKAEVEKAYEDHLKQIEAKYEQELKEAQTKASDSEARAKQLEKELENETAKHASELKSQADMIASKLQEEIKTLKEEASANAKSKQSEEAGKDKLRLVNEITELKRQVEALGLSGSDLEKSYILRKLAMVMGVFAFENAMLNGEPLEKEVEFLRGGDSLIDAAISSLPEEALKGGSLRPLQLQNSFVESKPKLRELILIPSTGGGAVSHLIARGASNLKVKEDNPDDGGIESVLDQVESLMKDGKLVEAAVVLEQSVEGTEAQSLVMEWAKQARLRAAIEQVNGVLRAHAASISMSLA
ncbi:uncharacterized protein LOC9657336 [Selaginella moellendorffii]|uniref:uncharacterized protein LOC9657336 n=1 Tax=Selaginella moellendorffii TaxID=88036 RepID=UPI000D1C708F|nr:uncharacterized protein LOC9657336 [Selaginella moellendorffii]|eukprot:XP_024541708.1 uncharacterized protein LOC9657336 [Selaginella moellendorffii]